MMLALVLRLPVLVPLRLRPGAVDRRAAAKQIVPVPVTASHGARAAG